MNKCPYVLKRFHALKKELQIFLLTIFQVPGMDLPEPREILFGLFFRDPKQDPTFRRLKEAYHSGGGARQFYPPGKIDGELKS